MATYPDVPGIHAVESFVHTLNNVGKLYNYFVLMCTIYPSDATIYFNNTS